MSLARLFAARLFSALLIVATIAAGHQHRLVVPATGSLAVDQARDVAVAKAEVEHCAVCRALQTTEPLAHTHAAAPVAANADVALSTEHAPASRPVERRASRAPPASLA